MFTTDPRTKSDFSARAYEQFMLELSRGRGHVAHAVRALSRGAAAFILRVLNAMYESRRRQALAVLDGYGDLMASEPGPEARASGGQTQQGERPRLMDTALTDAVYDMRIRCPITGAPCEGDHAHLCVEWGCARKGGLSPISHENFN